MKFKEAFYDLRIEERRKVKKKVMEECSFNEMTFYNKINEATGLSKLELERINQIIASEGGEVITEFKPKYQ